MVHFSEQKNIWITVIIGLKVDLSYKSTCIRRTIEGHAAFKYQKIFKNALKTAYLDHYGMIEIRKFALEIMIYEITLIQVEGFLNLR